MSAIERTTSSSWAVEKLGSTWRGRSQRPATALRWSSAAWWEDRVRTSRVSPARTSFTAQRSRRWLDAAQSSDSSSVRCDEHGRRPSSETAHGRALIKVHLDRYEASGVELIMGQGRFVAQRLSASISTPAANESSQQIAWY